MYKVAHSLLYLPLCILKDWKQQELLQVVVWNLDNKELYYLSALVMVCEQIWLENFYLVPKI